jgi:L-amino acid N-acyltransferase YncA
VRVRPAGDADFGAIAAITNHYITTTPIHFAYEPVTADELAATWRAHAKHPWLGRGLGRALYGALLDACARAGFHSAVADITLPNDASIALHERCGFEPVGVFRAAGFKLGRWHDVAWYQKRLADAPA